MSLSGVVDLIKRHEGLSLTPYRCTTGHHTIGYGHNIDANPLTGYIDFYFVQNGHITEDMADYLLDRDIIEAGKWANIYTVSWSSLSQNRKYVIVSMLFNLGLEGFLSFKRMRAAIEAGDFSRAADEMKDSLWYTQVGKRSQELERMMREG
mgnify:CR=1 FL=1